jgi:hypothetical protein
VSNHRSPTLYGYTRSCSTCTPALRRLRNFPVDSPLTEADLVACPKAISDAMRGLLQDAHAAECERPAYRMEPVSVLLVGTTKCPKLKGANDVHDHDVEVGVAVTDLRGIPLVVFRNTCDNVAHWAESNLVDERFFLIVCCDACAGVLHLHLKAQQPDSRVAVLKSPIGHEWHQEEAQLRWPLSAQLRQMRRAMLAWKSTHLAPLGDPALYTICSLKALANATSAAAMCKRRQRSLVFSAMVPMQLNSVTAGEGIGGNAAKRLAVSITGKNVVDQGAFHLAEDLFGNTCAIVNAELTLPSFQADPHSGLNVNLSLLPIAAGRNRLVRTLYQLRIAGNLHPPAQAHRLERDTTQEGHETDHDEDDVRDAHPPQPTVAPTQARQSHPTRPPTNENRHRGPAKEVVDGLVKALVLNRASKRSRKDDGGMGYVKRCLSKHKESFDAAPDRPVDRWPVTVQAEYVDEFYYTAAMYHLGAAFAPLLRYVAPLSHDDAYLFFEESSGVRLEKLTARVFVTLPKYMAIDKHYGDGVNVCPGSHPPTGLHPVRFLHDVLAHPAMKRDRTLGPQRFVGFIIRAELLPLSTWRMAEARDFCPMLKALLTNPGEVKKLLAPEVKRFKHARQQPKLQDLERHDCKVYVGYDAVRALDAAIKGGQGEISRVAVQIRELLLSFVDSVHFCHPKDNPDSWFAQPEKRSTWGSVLVTPNDANWDKLSAKAKDKFARQPPLSDGRRWVDNVARDATTRQPIESKPWQRLQVVISPLNDLAPIALTRPKRAPERSKPEQFYEQPSANAAAAMQHLVENLRPRNLRHGRVLFYGADIEAEYNLTEEEESQWRLRYYGKPSPLKPVEIRPRLGTGLWTNEAVPSILEPLGESGDDEEEADEAFAPDQRGDPTQTRSGRGSGAVRPPSENTEPPRKSHRAERQL